MDNTELAYKKIGRYGLWFAVAGIISYMTFFPSGIYYSFFCGAVAVTASIVSKRHARGFGSTIGLILGFIDIVMGVMAFYGLYLIYTAVADPVEGPKIVEFLSNLFAQYGLSVDTFAKLMAN